MARTIQSPGVEINEIDLSQTATLPVGTNVLVAGFAPKGPTDELVTVTSISEFEQVYGTPISPAERYFYHTVTPLFNSPATVQIYRLPYGANNGAGFGSNYGALIYPVTAVDISTDGGGRIFGQVLTTYTQYNSGVLYIVGQPTHAELNYDQYTDFVANNVWSNSLISNPATVSLSNAMSRAGIVVINKAQTTINNLFEGYYVGMADNTKMSPAYNYDTIVRAETVTQSATQTNSYIRIPTTRLNFALSSTVDSVLNTQFNSSVSQVMQDAAQFDINIRGYDDTLTIGVFKLRQSVFSPDTTKLDYSLSEKYVGSVDYYREINSQNGGAPRSFFLGTAEDQSPNVEVYVNDYLSHKNGTTWLDLSGNPSNKIRMMTSQFANVQSMMIQLSAAFGCKTSSNVTTLTPVLQRIYNNYYNDNINTGMRVADSILPVGAYQSTNSETKDLGSIPAKLDRMFNIVEDTDLYNIDLTTDGGLSTIFAVSEYLNDTAPLASGIKYFNDAITVDAVDGLSQTDPTSITGSAGKFREDWNTIFARYANFAQYRRKDHLFIADLPRHIFIQGANTLTLSDPNNTFSQNIYNPIKNILVAANTSYATTYANWAKVYDSYLDDQCWVPFSGSIAATMANTDANFQPWYAPAGFTRGVVAGVNNVALFPKQKQRDQLYKISVNPITLFPNDGIVIYGQKTLLKRPSAFDRINVRRLFLFLEKATGATVKYFVFEPNTLLTRTRVVNTLTPIFDNAKNTEGVYDYLIVCDERNNTPAVIDANELVIDIYLKPVRTAEFILVNFYATRTDTNFNELVS